MSNKFTVGYSIEEQYPERKRSRKSFRHWLGNKILGKQKNLDDGIIGISSSSTYPFNNSFDGWTIRMHKANGGHIVEAWKNEDSGRAIPSNYRAPHELFMVLDDEDIANRLNDILVQLALRN